MKYPSIESKIMLQVARGDSPDAIAERLGISVVDVLQQIDRDSGTQNNSQTEYEPTIEEIRHACREIQSEWTADEEARRRTGLIKADRDRRFMTAPTVKTPILD